MVVIAEITSNIRREHANAEWAVLRATDRIRIAYESLEDEYFRERGGDIENVVERILFNLSGQRQINWARLPKDLVLVARDFNPSTFALIDLSKVQGLALESGGRTSHTAIIARSLRLPVVTEIRDLLTSIATGDPLLLNADEGTIVVNPTPEQLNRVQKRLEEFRAAEQETTPLPGAPVMTVDGVEISLLANTELPHEVRAAKRCGAQGIGLFRSEFLFFAHPHGLPDMQAQLETYSMLAQEISPYPVSIRTLDAGEEAQPAGADASERTNPSMGLRGIRLSLRDQNLFATQIEAVLRATQFGKMEIVLPMISTVEELWQARAVIRRVHQQLVRAGVPVNDPVPVGLMIEVPSAVLMLESLSREADFLCVGTNDLIQYTLAVDRRNPEVAHLFQPLHPSILQLLIRIAEVSRVQGKPVRVCGEISSNPFFVALLLGMGFTQLSMNAYEIPTIRKVVSSLSLDTSRWLVERARTCITAREIADLLVEEIPRMVKIDLTPYLKEILSSDDSASLRHVS